MNTNLTLRHYHEKNLLGGHFYTIMGKAYWVDVDFPRTIDNVNKKTVPASALCCLCQDAVGLLLSTRMFIDIYLLCR